MSVLDFLTQGTPGPTDTTNTAAQRTLPDWYNQYIQGIANKAGSIASQPYQPYPGQKVADFNDDQRAAFDAVHANQGSYQPDLTAAGTTLAGAAPAFQGGLSAASGYGGAATGAVTGPSQSWTDPGTVSKYMSPYTENVVNEIGRLGNRNLTENLLPQVGSQFVGSGQFGSQRGVDAISHTIRDSAADTLGQQSTALQSGYNTGANIFGADANRAQGQQQLQANTNLGAGALANTTAGTAANGSATLAGAQGALGQLQQQLGYNDATSLGGIGAQQQALEQKGYDTGLNEFNQQRDWDWSQLGKVQGAVNGVQLPTGVTQSTNAPVQNSSVAGGASPLQWMTGLTGLYNATQGTG